MKTITKALFLVVFLFSAFDSNADDCDKLNLTDCLNLISAEIDADRSAEFQEISAQAEAEIFDAKRALSVSTTGDVPISILGNEVSLNDLLPLLNIAVDPGTSGDTNESAGISLEFSPNRKVLGGDIKLAAAIRKPEVSEPFVKAIDDSEIVASLNSGLDYSDDIGTSLTYSFEGSIFGRGIGRSLATYKDLSDGIVAAATHQANQKSQADPNFAGALVTSLKKAFPSQQAAIVAVIRNGPLIRLREVISLGVVKEGSTQSDATELVNRIKQARITAGAGHASGQIVANCVFHIEGIQDAGISDAAADELGNCVYENVLAVAREGVQKSIDRTNLLNEFLVANNFYSFASLIGNQPQLLISAGARYRDELAGGNSYNAKLSFEFDMSGHNVNNMQRYLNSQRNNRNFSAACNAELGATTDLLLIAESCAGEIGDYIGNNPIESGGWRGSVSVEYEDKQEAMFEVPGLEDPLKLDGGSSLIGSVAVGRQLQIVASSLPKAKLDFSLSYEDVSDDPNRQNRALGAVTFTQQLAEGLQLSIGLVWANKPEYRPSVDEEISARIGLNYKLAGK